MRNMARFDKFALLLLCLLLLPASTISAALSPSIADWHWRTPQDFSAVVYGNGTFVALGVTDGTYGILTSADGVAWTTQAFGTNELSGVTYGNGQFVAVGGSGVIATSFDGVAWTIQPSGTSNTLNGVIYGKGTFVAWGSYGTILTSSDGLTWFTQPATTIQLD